MADTYYLLDKQNKAAMFLGTHCTRETFEEKVIDCQKLLDTWAEMNSRDDDFIEDEDCLILDTEINKITISQLFQFVKVFKAVDNMPMNLWFPFFYYCEIIEPSKYEWDVVPEGDIPEGYIELDPYAKMEDI